MLRRWLGLLSSVGMLVGCAGLEVNDSAPRCEATADCAGELVCYRKFCVEPDDAEDVEADARDAGSDAGRRDAAAAPGIAADAGATGLDAGSPSVQPVVPPASPAPVAPVAPAVTPSPAPAPPAPANVAASPWRWPWRFEQLRNLPAHLLGCLGSCTVVGQKECESCVADKERQRASESQYFCDRDDEDEEDDEGSGRCGARR